MIIHEELQLATYIQSYKKCKSIVKLTREKLGCKVKKYKTKGKVKLFRIVQDLIV